jgi:hypothetical protein
VSIFKDSNEENKACGLPSFYNQSFNPPSGLTRRYIPSAKVLAEKKIVSERAKVECYEASFA